VAIAQRLSVELRQHKQNLGYGGNQKTCYQTALSRGADVVVMLHPDYQCEPRLLVAMAAPICYGVYDVVLGSRILGGGARSGGMPWLKYVVNRALTFFQNLVFRRKLSEYHTGYRAFDRKILRGGLPPVGGASGAHVRGGRARLSHLPGADEAARAGQKSGEHR